MTGLRVELHWFEVIRLNVRNDIDRRKTWRNFEIFLGVPEARWLAVD